MLVLEELYGVYHTKIEDGVQYEHPMLVPTLVARSKPHHFVNFD